MCCQPERLAGVRVLRWHRAGGIADFVASHLRLSVLTGSHLLKGNSHLPQLRQAKFLEFTTRLNVIDTDGGCVNADQQNL